MSADPRFDVLVIGAGPAGCSAALWLAEYGLHTLLLDRRPQACAGLDEFTFAQDWLLGSPGRTLAEIGAGYRQHIAQRGDLVQRYGTEVSSATRLDDGGWQLGLSDDGRVSARAVVIATGVSPVRPSPYFDAPLVSPQMLDAVDLTRRRASLAGARVLLLGGGDNAAENALSLARDGARVVVAARGALRAQRRYMAALESQPAIALRLHAPLPQLRRDDRTAYLARWTDGAEQRFDAVAVLFGYQPNLALLALLGAADALPTGVFLAGDCSGRLHPCLASAIGDGADAAHQVERWLADA